MAKGGRAQGVSFKSPMPIGLYGAHQKRSNCFLWHSCTNLLLGPSQTCTFFPMLLHFVKFEIDIVSVVLMPCEMKAISNQLNLHMSNCFLIMVCGFMTQLELYIFLQYTYASVYWNESPSFINLVYHGPWYLHPACFATLPFMFVAGSRCSISPHHLYQTVKAWHISVLHEERFRLGRRAMRSLLPGCQNKRPFGLRKLPGQMWLIRAKI